MLSAMPRAFFAIVRLSEASGGSVCTTAYSSAARVLLVANGRLPVHI